MENSGIGGWGGRRELFSGCGVSVWEMNDSGDDGVGMIGQQY